MASHVYVLLLIALLGPFSYCFGESRKELRSKVREEGNNNTIMQLGSSIQSNRIDPSRVVPLSWQPRVFLYKGFLTDDECDHLISLAQGTREISEGKGDDSGKIVQKRLLASSGSLLNTDDNIVARTEERISAWTLLPKENSKALQVTHYGVEEGKQDLDYVANKSALILSGPWMATIILYLSNVTRGGQILFPESEVKSKIWSDCMKTSNVLRPIKGNAILFFTLHLNASVDPRSSHARCPVLEGELWYATKLFHVKAVDRGKSLSDSDGSECTDEDENCPRWAAFGECQRNPVFMIGSPDYYGTCRKSCNVC